MRKSLLIVTMAVFAVAGSTACATKGFVRTQVEQVDQRVGTLSQSLEETQERTRQNEGRIGDVDQKAQAAQGAAQTAQGAAQGAQSAADAAAQRAAAANDRAEAVDMASRRLVYEVVLSENQGNFKFGGATLPDEAKGRIDELVAKIKAEPKNVYFEIEGHTDNVGDKTINERLGLARADAVKKYLYEQHQIPLHRMNIISLGSEKPLAPNTTREGRAQNRAVVIRVLG